MQTHSNPVHVLLSAQELTQGGSERQLTEIAKALDPARFIPHVAVFRPHGLRLGELRDAGIQVVCFPIRSFAAPGVLVAARAMRRYLRQHHIRLVHAFDTPANLFAVPVARVCGVPVVVSSQRAFRDLWPWPYRRLLRFTDHIVDAVVVNCRALERYLVEHEHVPAKRVRLCHNGIDTSRFYPAASPGPASLANASLVIGCVAALRPEKGLDILLRAFAFIARAHAGLRLVIVGDGPMRHPLENLAHTLGIAGQALFVPAAADVVPWLRAMDIFVLPSLSESFSNSLLEAMACGCCAVASNVGGNPELVLEGRTGLLFRSRDVEHLQQRLDLLIRNSGLRRQMAEAGSVAVRTDFPLAVAAARMDEIYSTLLDHAKKDVML